MITTSLPDSENNETTNRNELTSGAQIFDLKPSSKSQQLMTDSREREERYKALVETQSELIIRVSLDGHYTFVNDAYCKKAGQTRDQLLGKKFSPQVHPEDQQRVWKFFQEALQSKARNYEEHRSWTPVGWRTILWETYAVRDAKGEVIEVQGVGRDITEQRLAEQRLREQAIQLQRRNEELQQFAYVASHDLKEPLRMITTFLNLLDKKHGKQLPDEGREYLNYAIEGGRRMFNLISDLLAYTHTSQSKLRWEDVDCRQVLDAACLNLKMKIYEAKAEVVAESLPKIRGSFSLLVELFQNLIDNSIKYRSERTPKISIRSEDREDHWEFAFTDNGIGIAPQFQNRIFEIFQRLHSKTEGTGNGIGLTIAKKIVERHGGGMRVESFEGEGATFYFTISKDLPQEF